MATSGLASGVQDAGSSRPVAGDHEQALPPEPWSGADWPRLIVAEPDATATGRGSTVTVTVGAFVEDRPCASVTVRV